MISRSTIFVIIAIIIANIQYNCITEYTKDAVLSTQLKTNVFPVHYNISIYIIDFASLSFSGHVEIDVQLTEPTTEILLHSSNLKIFKVHLFQSNNIPIDGVSFDDTFKVPEIFVIKSKKYLSKQTLKIKIDYKGNLNKDSPVGIFVSNYYAYIKQFGIEWYAFTFLEPIFARTVFPCFDEPKFKATFDVNVGRPRGYMSLSSMPLSHTWQKEGYFVDVFEKSPKMSPFQIAFAIFNFPNITNGTIRVFAPRNDFETYRTNFTLEISLPILKAIENYTDIKFSLKKLDQVVFPKLPINIMATWGLIGFSDNSVLQNKELSPSLQKQNILKTVTQQFVLQWFGNLVTPQWWNSLWLKKGFASYLTHKIAQKVKPAWRMEEQYLLTVQTTFDSDTETIVPMTSHGDSIFRLQKNFNSVIYDKAGAVLRMLEHAISSEIFRESLISYLKKHQYGVAKPSDLWNAIQDTIDLKKGHSFLGTLTIRDIMLTWETESGFPIILVDRFYKERRVTDRGPIGVIERIETKEGMYIEHVNPPVHEDDKKTWHLPLNWATQDNPDFSNTSAVVWRNTTDVRPVTFSLADDKWLIVNKQATGYYRINYDYRNWMLIINYLNTTDYNKIHVLNRAQLIDDAFHLGRSQHLHFFTVLELTKYLHRETDYIVHKAFFRNLEYFNKKACWAPLYNLFEQYVATLLEPSYVKLGSVDVNNADDEHIDNLHRAELIHWVCRLNNTDCRIEATQRLSSLHFVSQNMRSTIACAGLRGANEEEFKSVALKVVNLALPQHLRFELGCGENKKILLEFLEGEIRRTKDTTVFRYIYSKSNIGTKFVFYYILAHFNELHKRFGDTIGEVIVDLSPQLSTSEHLFWIRDLRRRATTQLLMERFDSAIETIETNNNWATAYYGQITGWIKTEL